MLEIILLFVLGKKISAICQEKGRRGWPFVLLFIVLWFGFEIAGCVVGVIVSLIMAPDEEPGFLFVWLFGVGGAALGAILSFIIVNNLEPTIDPVEESWR